MSSLRFRDRKAAFHRLDADQQRRLFALGCFQSAHVEAGFPARIAAVEREVEDALRRLYGDSAWRAIERRGDVDAVLGSFEHGDAVNHVLSWYLESEFGRFSCRTESVGTASEFDVTVHDGGVPVCGIELKRAGSSNRIERYLDHHRHRCRDDREARNYLLVNLFPITERMDPVRTGDMVFGYGPLSARVHEFYERENSHVANVPAPLFRRDGEFDPLGRIRDVLETDLEIGR